MCVFVCPKYFVYLFLFGWLVPGFVLVLLFSDRLCNNWVETSATLEKIQNEKSKKFAPCNIPPLISEVHKLWKNYTVADMQSFKTEMSIKIIESLSKMNYSVLSYSKVTTTPKIWFFG